MERATAGRAKLLTAILGGAIVAATGILFWFDPGQYGFYPQCIFHNVTGYLCPGCGSLRAIHQLLHGHVATAWHLNALLVGGLPVLGTYASLLLWRRRAHPRAAAEFPLGWLWVSLAVIFAFGLLRNLPGAHFAGLNL